MWFLAATTDMRRSALAGVERGMLDLDNGVVVIEGTRVVVAGRAERSERHHEWRLGGPRASSWR
jgi:hypothetical protein